MHLASNFRHQTLEAKRFFLRLADLLQIQTRPNKNAFASTLVGAFELQV